MAGRLAAAVLVGAPEGTQSYAVTMYDPDAPTQSGFWHWVVADIPASVTRWPRTPGRRRTAPGCPAGPSSCVTTRGAARFIGAAPPAGHGVHRYFITVHALDVATIGIPADATPAFFGFNMLGHILGRATIVTTAEIKS